MAGYTNNLADTNNQAYEAGERTVSTTQVLACANGSSNLAGRQNIIVFNRSLTETLYIGPTGVTTTSKGIPLPPQACITLNVGYYINVYLIAASGSHTVTVQEIS